MSPSADRDPCRDTIYFYRVHPFFPIIHQCRHLSWAHNTDLGPARLALRLAMWTIATAFSAQYRALGKSLYLQAQQLASFDGAQRELPWDTADLQLEQTQACLLLAAYEFVCMDRDCTLLTAARVYRMVQAAGLHNIDVGISQATDEETMIVNEEKRRTFWAAFCLDRLVTAQDSLQITLQEETVSCVPQSCLYLMRYTMDVDSGIVLTSEL